MLFDGEFSDEWEDGEARESRFCFIGKNLDRQQVPTCPSALSPAARCADPHVPVGPAGLPARRLGR